MVLAYEIARMQTTFTSHQHLTLGKTSTFIMAGCKQNSVYRSLFLCKLAAAGCLILGLQPTYFDVSPYPDPSRGGSRVRGGGGGSWGSGPQNFKKRKKRRART